MPPPDFPGGGGESKHVGRGQLGDLSRDGRKAMGFEFFDLLPAITPGQQAAHEIANRVLMSV
jgi:hypothetical protein